MPVYQLSDSDFEKMGWTGYLTTSETGKYAHDNSEKSQQNMIHQNFDMSELGTRMNDTRSYSYNHFGNAHASTEPKPSDRSIFLQPPLTYWNPIKHDPFVSSAPDLEKHEVPFVCHKQLEKQIPSALKCRWEGCTYKGTFTKEASLVRHVKATHISPEMYQCLPCKKTFGRKDRFSAHMRLVHPDMCAANGKRCHHCHHDA
ncbi:uncharacterized protein N7483_008796 [Penicillium malachiteum]|uniref:uncharacterized protein n=1 Tax=Penicillium malachiteum TaxID=1324776 RepID=UPI002546F652|nr:uncharacterized protein N7483_008796 [Penicillium malachiteum]KAJ5720862.1 hypothetical protein N7483_008796 [Penicillium malachiteum]